MLDIPGDPAATPLVLLHEGLGSVRPVAGLSRTRSRRPRAGEPSRSRATATGESDPPRTPRTPTFMHEEALEVLPELLAALNIEAPVLVGHSDGASIALIYAAHHPVEAVVAIAPHVFVEDICLGEIERAKAAYSRRRPAGSDGPAPPRPGRRVLRLERRVARSGIPVMGDHRGGDAHHLPAAADPGRARPVRNDGPARRDRTTSPRSGHPRPPRLPALAADRAAGRDGRCDRAIRRRHSTPGSPRSRSTVRPRRRSSRTTWRRSRPCTPSGRRTSRRA